MDAQLLLLDATTTASDSMRFGSWDSNLMTEFHARYGGHRVMIYWHTSATITARGGRARLAKNQYRPGSTPDDAFGCSPAPSSSTGAARPAAPASRRFSLAAPVARTAGSRHWRTTPNGYSDSSSVPRAQRIPSSRSSALGAQQRGLTDPSRPFDHQHSAPALDS
jgi:hypothetical protein